MARPSASMVDFLCTGAQKAGTSRLREAPRRRPGVFTPPVKELHHCGHCHASADRASTALHPHRGVRRALRRHANHAAPFDRAWIGYLVDLADRDPFTLAWHARAFPRAPEGMLRLDAAPECAGPPPTGVAEALADNLAMKVLHIRRDRADRALSQIRMGFARRAPTAPQPGDWRAALKDPDLAERADHARHIAAWEEDAPGRLTLPPVDPLAQAPPRFFARVERIANLPPGPRGPAYAARTSRRRSMPRTRWRPLAACAPPACGPSAPVQRAPVFLGAPVRCAPEAFERHLTARAWTRCARRSTCVCRRRRCRWIMARSTRLARGRGCWRISARGQPLRRRSATGGASLPARSRTGSRAPMRGAGISRGSGGSSSWRPPPRREGAGPDWL